MAMANWAPRERTDSYSALVSRMGCRHEPSLHSQMYSSIAGWLSMRSLDAWIHSLNSRKRTWFSTSSASHSSTDWPRDGDGCPNGPVAREGRLRVRNTSRFEHVVQAGQLEHLADTVGSVEDDEHPPNLIGALVRPDQRVEAARVDELDVLEVQDDRRRLQGLDEGQRLIQGVRHGDVEVAGCMQANDAVEMLSANLEVGTEA